MYTVQILTDKLIAQALDGTKRLAKQTFKTPKDAPADFKKHVNRGVIIPQINIPVQIECLAEALQAAFEEMQDAVIRNIIVTALDAGTQKADGTLKSIIITDEQISMEATAKFWALNREGNKLSKDMLTKWFDSDLSDTLTLKLSELMKLPDAPSEKQIEKLEKGVAEYKAMYIGLAAPKAKLPDDIAKQLQGALKLATDSRTKTTLQTKLSEMLQPTKLALSIGFAMDDEEEVPDDEETNDDSNAPGTQQPENLDFTQANKQEQA